MATKPGGGGLKALVAGPLRKELFAASHTDTDIFFNKHIKSIFYTIFQSCPVGRDKLSQNRLSCAICTFLAQIILESIIAKIRKLKFAA